MSDQSTYYKRKDNGHAYIEVVGIHESGDYLTRWIFGTEEPFRFHKYEFDKDFVQVEKEEIDKLERQRCGRRNESAMGLEKESLPDYWCIYSNGDKTCSFCGSLHPDSVIEIVKAEGFGSVELSDKEYKLYVRRNGTTNAGDGGIKYYRQHDTPGFVEEYHKVLTNKKVIPPAQNMEV